GVCFSEIQLKVVDLGERLVPGVDRLDVDRTDPAAPLPDEVRDEMAPDEAAAAGHHDQVILPPHRSAPAAEMARDARGDQNRSTSSAVSTSESRYTRCSSLEDDRQDEQVDRVDLGNDEHDPYEHETGGRAPTVADRSVAAAF